MTELLRGTLQRARIESYEFPVTTVDQDGGRAVSEHEAWRRDGAELVDGGRKAYRGSLTAVLVNTIPGYGELYPRRLEDLVRAFETRGEMELAHPLLGTFRVMVPTWKPRLEAKVRNGAFLDFTWTEQRASAVGVVTTSTDRGTGDPEAEVPTAAAAADEALSAAGVAQETSLVAVVTPALDTATAEGVPFADLSRALGSITTATTLASSTLAARPYTASTATTIHAARRALAELDASVSRLRAALLPDPARTRVYVAPRRMSLAEVSQAVYGTPSRAADLRVANGLAGAFVSPGRSLQVLP